MGIQKVRDVTLLRHAYVLTRHQRNGVGAQLLKYLLRLAKTSAILVGTWRLRGGQSASMKTRVPVDLREETNRLLKEYWNIPERQVETSVVLKLQRHG